MLRRDVGISWIRGIFTHIRKLDTEGFTNDLRDGEFVIWDDRDDIRKHLQEVKSKRDLSEK